MFIFRKQHSLLRLRHCTMLNVPQSSKSCPKNKLSCFLPRDVT